MEAPLKHNLYELTDLRGYPILNVFIVICCSKFTCALANVNKGGHIWILKPICIQDNYPLHFRLFDNTGKM